MVRYLIMHPEHVVVLDVVKVPAVKPNKKAPKALQNDAELITAYLSKDGTKITKVTVDAIPGGKGFSGPVGFYLQMGGDPKKLPKL